MHELQRNMVNVLYLHGCGCCTMFRLPISPCDDRFFTMLPAVVYIFILYVILVRLHWTMYIRVSYLDWISLGKLFFKIKILKCNAFSFVKKCVHYGKGQWYLCWHERRNKINVFVDWMSGLDIEFHDQKAQAGWRPSSENQFMTKASVLQNVQQSHKSCQKNSKKPQMRSEQWTGISINKILIIITLWTRKSNLCRWIWRTRTVSWLKDRELYEGMERVKSRTGVHF